MTCVLQVHAIGSNTMKSPEKWGSNTIAHRKREGYIAAYRAYFELGNYANWSKFHASDFHMRNRLARTFMARHLPLSDGEEHSEFEGLLEEPATWSDVQSPEKITAKTKPATELKTPVKKKIKLDHLSPSTPARLHDVTKLVMDPQTGCFVECIDIDA